MPLDKKLPDEKTKEVIVTRTEFIIFLVWDERFLGAEAAATPVATKE